MTLRAMLTELEQLLDEEERSLVTIDLDRVVALSGRKQELVEEVEVMAGSLADGSSADLAELVRSVRSKALHNCFLLRHLRCCLTTVEGKTGGGPIYGPDGRQAGQGGPGGVVRVRL